MSEIVVASINSLLSSQQAELESQSEDPIFLITASQLKSIVAQAIREATVPLKNRISRLEASLNIPNSLSKAQNQLEKLQDKLMALKEENLALKSKLEAVESWGERLALDRALDGQRIAKLELKATVPTPPKGEKTLARIAKIDEVLKTRGATVLKELRRILGIDKATMTRLLGKLDKRRYELHTRPGDGREKVLRLRAQIS
jgi:DNA-binding MarR family transcriptional regulator